MEKSQRNLYSLAATSEDDDLSQGLLFTKEGTFDKQRSTFWRRHRNMLLVQVVLLVVYTLTLYLAVAKIRSQSLHGPNLIHSPASEAVIWEEHKFTLEDRLQEKSEYSGRPSPALDKAWHDLLNYENIRIEPEVMKRLGREDIGVRVPGGDDYIGTLNVYHELHCLKRLHQYMYQETYWADLDDAQREMNRLHNEHCLDFLRQSAICHGDVGLITFGWIPTNRIPVANATTHQCVNWNKLDQWTKDRSVDMLKPGWLQHPTLGLAYPGGEVDRIGAATGGGHNH
ncbi:hypothetical protein BDR22DRAFT_461182 [Usnea florida]